MTTNRVNRFIQGVPLMLPRTESEHLSTYNMPPDQISSNPDIILPNLYEWVTEMVVGASFISDEIIQSEYNRALAVYRLHGPPPQWIIDAIDETINDILTNSKRVHQRRILDLHKNIQFNRHIAKHDFCLRLRRDLLEVTDAPHHSSP
jgi:hypothetical protein